MDDTPINLENILEQAPKWTFAGDFTLLQWMNQISQDLESRAIKTTDALTKLNNNIRSTNVALDNVANSLTALQFGNQFVECRVQDDDETIMNTNEATTSSDNQNQTESTHSPKEMLDTFLENNLKVLRNCHEKYSIDLDDSEEEEDGKSKEKTCIYQPINPYNEKPLPYIFGSKDWHAKWHVGLYENQEENSYSDDEISEAFSESSSTSHIDDNESFESNTEWASSYSIDNDNINTNIEVKNASSLRGSQSIYPGTKNIPINANKNKVIISESSSLSTPSSSSLTKKSINSTKPNDILTNKSESINSLSSKNSPKPIAKENRDNTLATKIPTQKYVDLFAEPPEDVQSTSSSTGSSSTHNQMQTEYNKQTVASERPSTIRSQPPPPFVDLFAEPPEDIPSSTTSSISSASQHIKRKTVNLFDDDEDNDLVKNDLLSAITKKEELQQTNNLEKTKLPTTKTLVLDKPFTTTTATKTSKSLFEDSEEDDDDFLKAFVKKSSVKETPKTSLTKSLFDNEISEITASKPVNETKSDGNGKELPIKTQNIFNEIEDNENDSLFSKVKNKNEVPKLFVATEDNTKLENVSAVSKDISAKTPKEDIKKTVNIFDDLEDDFKPQSLQPKDKPKKINLFDDLDDDDEGDDIFAIKPKQIVKEKTNAKVTIGETMTKENLSEEIDNATKTDHKNIGNKEITFEETTKKSLANMEQMNDHIQVTVEDKKLEEPFMKSLANIDQNNELKNATKRDVDFEKPVANIKDKIDHKHDENIEEPVMKSLTIKEHKQKDLSPTLENVNEATQILNQEVQSDERTNKLKPELTENKEILENNNSVISKEKVDLEIETKLENAEIIISKKQKEDVAVGVKSQLETTESVKSKELNNNDTTLPKEQPIPISTEATTKPTTSKYDFNSVLFLDEPPEDDNEFFENLTKTPQTLNTNYNSIDLENDLYEPELPKVPGNNGNTKQTDAVESKPTNVYTGLQLFSDIPPEDDGDNDDIGSDNIATISNDNNQTKRLHSVFYDDFNETLMALNKNQIDKDIPKHSIFYDEPPPINEEFSSLSKDSIENKVPELKTEDITKEDFKSKTSEIVSKLEETQSKLDNKTDSNLSTSKRPVSKLQMPHININVQALLPGANNTLRKVKEEISPPKINDEIKTNTNISAIPTKVEKQTSVLEKSSVEVKRTAETEHILPSVTKNRIKGPARRPSTRRARQENYRKSMIEQEHLESDDNKPTQNKDLITSVTNIPKKIVVPAEENTKTELSKEHIKDKANEEKVINPLSSILFEDKTVDDLDIFNVTKKSNKIVDSNSKKITEELADKLKQVKKVDNETTKEQGILTKTVTNKKSSLLFEDDEEDDDLFKHIKTSKINENKPVKALDKTKEISSATDDKSVTNTTLNNTKDEVTKEMPVEGIPDAKTIIPKLDTKSQQALKTDVKPSANEIDKKINKPSSAIEVKPSFLEEKDDDGGNDIFKTNMQKPNNSKASTSNNIKAKSQFKSFLDSESDDDTMVAGLPTTSSIKSQTISNTTISNTKSTGPKNTNTKLFNESDTDSDDLFGKLSTTKTSNQKNSSQVSSVPSTIAKKPTKTQPQSSLFSDESDDDEDFLKSASKVTKKPTTKTNLLESKAKISSQRNASLFSDIDSDEDDLFGGGGATKGTTPKAAHIPTVKIPTTTKTSVAPPTADVVKSKTVTADNPLADLL